MFLQVLLQTADRIDVPATSKDIPLPFGLILLALLAVAFFGC